MNRFTRGLLFLATLAAVPSLVYAQATASIVGTARDASGAVLPGVTVEASSPALIEKTRTVVTNGVGQYSIVDLRPGTYTVTFTLPGFTTVRREGIELTGSFSATVNADMRVGGVAETITVSGQTPIVDVTSVHTQAVMSGATVNEIPTSRNYGGLISLVPAINVQGNDVGGSQGAIFNVFQVHGGRRNEGQVQVDGMSAGYQGMGVSSYVTEIGNAQEVVFSLSGGLGEAVTGGPQMNIIGKQGGNRFAGSFFINGTGSAFQTTNLTQELRDQGLTTAQSLAKAWDINPAFGGPIVRDRLWFFGTYRYQSNDQNVASMWVNLNAGDNTRWDYLPADGKDGRPLQVPIDDGRWKNGSVRLTFQATPRNKINFWTDYQRICQHCIEGGSSSGLTFAGTIASPEALQRVENRPNSMTQISWTSPVTNRVLLEASAQLGPYFWWGGTQKNSWDKTTIPVQDVGGLIPGLNYRSSNWADHTGFTNIVQGSMSYITGSHSTKFGFRYMANDSTFPKNFYNDAQLKYNFRNGVPYQFTMYADQGSSQQQHQGMFALYAQDRWTLSRLSLQGGLRFERLADHFGEQQMGPNVFLPSAVVFPAQDGPLNLKDIQPRFGAAYDVFGNGKTAVKFFLGRYVTTTNTVDEWASYSPAGIGHFVTSANRAWNDSFYGPGDPRTGNYMPDCELLNPAGNGECGGMSNPNFGKTVNNLALDPDVTSGWNKREYSWDLTAGVTQEIAPRVSVEVDYVRRSWGNMLTNINRALTPADFDSYVYTVPTDARLPGGGGYSLTFLDVKPEKFLSVDNFRTFSDSVGGQSNTFNGVDVSVNARLSDVTLQGGTSSGNVVEDNCGAAAAHPEILLGFVQSPQAYCHRESGWQTNVKGLVSYTVPKIDALFSATFHSLPYPGSNFPSVATQSLGATAIIAPQFQTNLGRPLASGSPIAFVSIVEPGKKYGDRLNGVDLRLGKIFRFAQTQTLVSVDIFNLFNSNAADVYQQTFGTTYLNPLSITQARFFKISVQFDF